ncbi:MAG: heavy metal-binding domain-containing protein [Candidatus Thiodiazotropha sp.]|jgi:uncharacterized protein YbjQ (UPF0145 family)
MIDLIILISLLALGYGFGTYTENKHYKSILEREKKFMRIPAITSRFPPVRKTPTDANLVSGSVVVSVDYFKQFIAALKNLFGGRVTSYESLVDRARREAILRMKAHADELKADIIFNVKLETSSIHKGRRNGIGSVEVLAYGTALTKHR